MDSASAQRPKDRPQGIYDRRLRDIVHYEHGEKIRDFHIPTDVGDYCAIYRDYLHDPDLQDARARWPFVCMWDNHEFSWIGWQSFQQFGGVNRPAQTRKVAANQACFEYQPARLFKPSGPSLNQFDPTRVVDAPINRFDENGLVGCGQPDMDCDFLHQRCHFRNRLVGRQLQRIVDGYDPSGFSRSYHGLSRNRRGD